MTVAGSHAGTVVYDLSSPCTVIVIFPLLIFCTMFLFFFFFFSTLFEYGIVHTYDDMTFFRIVSFCILASMFLH